MERNRRFRVVHCPRLAIAGARTDKKRRRMRGDQKRKKKLEETRFTHRTDTGGMQSSAQPYSSQDKWCKYIKNTPTVWRCPKLKQTVRGHPNKQRIIRAYMKGTGQLRNGA